MLANHYNILTKYEDFKRRKLELYSNPPKKNKIWLFHNSLLPQNVPSFSDFLEKVPFIILLGTFYFIAKWRISATKKPLVPALTTPTISPDTGCALSNNDQIHQFCNACKAPITGKLSSLKPTHAPVWRQAPTWGTCHDFMEWNYEQCFPAGNEGRKSYTKRRVDTIYMVRGKFWLRTANGAHFSLLTHGRRNPSMTTCIHYLIAKKTSDHRKLQV